MADGYGIDRITTELGAAAAAAETAQKLAAVIGPYADAAKARVLRAGLRGVARGIDQIKAGAVTCHAQVSDVVPAIRGLQSRAGTVSEDSTPQEVSTTLRPLLEGITQCKAKLAGSAEGVQGLLQLINRNLTGGSPEGLLARANPVRHAIQVAAAHLDAARTATEHSLTLAGQAGVGQGE